MKSILNFLELFVFNLTAMLSLGLFPVSMLGLVVMLAAGLITLNHSFTGLPDRNIPMDFMTHNELSALGYYLLVVLIIVIIISTIEMKLASESIH